jgi:ubiquinone/menaquinone biosynthesis C-methylase UbiE
MRNSNQDFRDSKEDKVVNDDRASNWFKQKISLSDPWYRLILKMIRPVVKSFERKKVLEIGCGLGVFCIYVAKEEGESIGLDISKSAIRNAKDMARRCGVQNRVQFVVGDARFLPFRNRVEDIVISTETLEHISNHAQAFHEFVRITDNFGYICLTVPNLVSSLFFEYVFFMFIGQPKYVKRLLNVEKEYIFHYFKVKRLIQSENLSIVDIRGTDFLHLHPKIASFFKLERPIKIVSSALESKKSLQCLGAHIGVIAKRK